MLVLLFWDKIVKFWDVFEGKGNVEIFIYIYDVLMVVYCLDSK